MTDTERTGTTMRADVVGTLISAVLAVFPPADGGGRLRHAAVLCFLALMAVHFLVRGRRRTRRAPLLDSIAVDRAAAVIVFGAAAAFCVGTWFGRTEVMRAAFACFTLHGLAAIMSHARPASRS